MADLVTIERVRAQLRIDAGTEDTLVEGLVMAAQRAVEVHTGRTVADGDNAFGADAPIAAQAVLLLVSTWYDNRDSVAPNTAAAELPLAVTWLLWPLKRLPV